jgi:hypothetical protein
VSTPPSSRRLSVVLPIEVSQGMRCSRGAVLQVPIDLDTTGIDSHIFTVKSVGDVVGCAPREVRVQGDNTRQMTVVLRLDALRETDEPTWVMIEVVGDREVRQDVGFFVEVFPTPEAAPD